MDTYPPLGFTTEQRLLFQPYPFYTRCIVPSDLFAGKIHALLFRQWKSRVKGRDWYDFEWYVRKGVPLDYNHLRTRINEFNGLDLSKDDFLTLLKERLSIADIESVKADAVRFVEDDHELDIWSNNYFLQLADMIKFV